MPSFSPLPRRIIVGLAFREHAEDELRKAANLVDDTAFAHATAMSEKFGAELLIVHAIEETDVDVVDAQGTLHHLIAEHAEQCLREKAAQAAQQGVRAHTALEVGPASQVLLRQAKSWGADLIVVGPHRAGYDLVERLLHGSTARSLFREAPACVYVAHVGEPVIPQRIVVAVDPEHAVTPQVLATANAVADKFGAQRAVIYCPQYPHLLAIRRLPDAEVQMAAYRAEVRAESKARLAHLLGERAREWSVIVSEESVAKTIHRAHQAREAQLCFIARNAGQSLAAKVIGGTAEKVLHHVEMNTWVVKPAG